uniref:Uncharacterized protein n=1 Tax=Setaria italica TaxID=4555 RepID=K3YNM9_SETIT
MWWRGGYACKRRRTGSMSPQGTSVAAGRSLHLSHGVLAARLLQHALLADAFLVETTLEAGLRPRLRQCSERPNL